jgi:hypothetical protein
MKIIIDRQKVTRRARAANIASLAGMLTLLGSAVLPLFRPQLGAISTLMMVVGLLVAMVGIYFANRWVKKPRPEDRLDAALKSLSDGYRLYHYPRLPCDHILLAPTGVVILETVNLDGQFSLKDGRWKERMTLGRALRWVVEEHLGNPSRSALSSAAYIQGRLAEAIPGGVDIPVKSVVVFTHPGARLEVEGEQTVPVCKVDRLKKVVVDKGKKLTGEVYEQVCAMLEA